VQRFGVIIGGVADGVQILYHFIQDNWSIIGPLILGIVAAMVAWKVITGLMSVISFLTSPIGLVGLAISALVALIFLLWKNWDQISAWIISLWQDYVLPFFQGIGPWFSNLWNGIVNGLISVWTSIPGWIIGLWQNYVLPFFQGIGPWFNNLWNGIVNGLISVWTSLPGLIIELWQNNILPFFQGVGLWFSSLWTGMVNGFMTAWTGIKTFFSGFWEGIIAGFKGYVNMMLAPVNQVISAFNKIRIDLPAWATELTGYSSFGVNIPMIPTFAEGGFANRPSIFGEAGPEAAIPLRRTPRSLSLLNQTANALGVGGANEGSGGSPTFVFSPTISGGDTGGIAIAVRAAGDEFFNQCEAWWESKRRLSFG
ncbi:MAG: hypothetical protein K6T85_01785, partial [Gorillibacterium sp.]|nr:hypothetical protein [Gorillibacterium sp.]